MDKTLKEIVLVYQNGEAMAFNVSSFAESWDFWGTIPNAEEDHGQPGGGLSAVFGNDDENFDIPCND